MSSLKTSIFPDVGVSIPPSKFNRVVLPAPDGPRSVINSPYLIFKDTLSNAVTFNSPIV